jgi:Zn-dependent M28 family amino/carboxypeptidase
MRRILPLTLLVACMPDFSTPDALVDSPGDGSDDPVGDSAEGAGTDTSDPDPAGPESLVAGMEQDRLLSHLEALQEIADANGDTRVVGTSGYEQSADYVSSQLEEAGYTVQWQEFTHDVWTVLSEPELETSTGSDWEFGDDYTVMGYSPGGDVSGPLAVIDVDIPPAGSENSSDSGCESSDFDDMAPGSIALIQRGSCTFADKAQNAESAGAVGVIIFNEGQSGRQDVVQGTLGEDTSLSIPVLGASYDLGADLADAADRGAVEVELVADVLRDALPTWNLTADLQGQTDQLLVVGAHLDSVSAGPGINDNGSGTAMVLELAIQAAAMEPEWTNTVRFAWWGAEESGLVGSYYYITELSDSEADRHLANLNFDMVASPNGLRFVYDGDNSTGDGYPGPDGSDVIEDLFTDYLDDADLDWRSTAFDGRSDYGPFIWTGIPAGGLFTGAEGTNSQTGQTLDPCYHQNCDTTGNLDADLFLEMAQTGAHVTEVVAQMSSLSPSARMAPSPRDLGMAPPEHHSRAEGGCGHALKR